MLNFCIGEIKKNHKVTTYIGRCSCHMTYIYVFYILFTGLVCVQQFALCLQWQSINDSMVSSREVKQKPV